VRGLARVDAAFTMMAAAYNLRRLAGLAAAAPWGARDDLTDRGGNPYRPTPCGGDAPFARARYPQNAIKRNFFSSLLANYKISCAFRTPSR